MLSTCPNFLSIVKVEDSAFIQFSHFSIKEFLTSNRLAETEGIVSRFHVSMNPAHTIMAQACLGILLHLDENITSDSLKGLPLAEYAAKSWHCGQLYNIIGCTVILIGQNPELNWIIL